MATYNVGEKVRIISKRGNCWNPKGLMDKYCGTVMTIRDNHKWGSDGLYAMEEDKHENGGGGWCWNDSDIVGRVKDEKPQFKVGDKVRITGCKDDFTDHLSGKVCEVISVRDNDIEVKVAGVPFTWMIWKHNAQVVTDEKIVITHDGKVTTATMYGVMGNKVTATARCAPDDVFDFTVGAKLTMERLMEQVAPAVEPKDEPITVGGFKIGDRVNYDGVNGTVICFIKGEYDSIGVEFDKPLEKVACHNCKGFPLMAGAVGTKGSSRWMLVSQLTAGEVPQYYNGKVVCVKRGYGVSIPILDFTAGRIYDVVDGKITGDDGWVSNCPSKTIKELCVGMGWTFIELVE